MRPKPLKIAALLANYSLAAFLCMPAKAYPAFDGRDHSTTDTPAF
jgi:hypothetical protein